MATPGDMLYEMLTKTGDATGSADMVGAAAVYKLVAKPGYEFVLVRMNIYVEDNGQFRGDRYGSTGALTNGIRVRVMDTDGSVIKDLTPYTIKKIGHWGLQAGIDVYGTNYTTGNNTWLVRWTFERGGNRIVLQPGQYLEFETQDNMGAGGAALVEHYAQVQGFRNDLDT
jgi:hypothetical protein